MSVHAQYRHLFLNISDLQLVESMDLELMDIEGSLYFTIFICGIMSFWYWVPLRKSTKCVCVLCAHMHVCLCVYVYWEIHFQVTAHKILGAVRSVISRACQQAGDPGRASFAAPIWRQSGRIPSSLGEPQSFSLEAFNYLEAHSHYGEQSASFEVF